MKIPESVSSIDSGGFSGCANLVDLGLPEGITIIEPETFSGCRGLARISIPPAVTRIKVFAFDSCRNLTHVSIPRTVEYIGYSAFANCDKLRAVLFLGDAPELAPPFLGGLGEPVNTFPRSLKGFTIYYLSGSSGFQSPRWNGYPTRRIEEPFNAEQFWLIDFWLIEHGYPPDAPIDETNDAGVSLLTAYALGLDPEGDLSEGLPLPILESDRLSTRFYAGRPELEYAVERSTDLQNWTTDGVQLTDPDEEGRRTATVQRQEERQFLRLRVNERQ